MLHSKPYENDSDNCKINDLENSLSKMTAIKVDYAIISAMPEELEFFTEEFSNQHYIEYTVGKFHFKVYDYRNSKILITYSGLGVTFAASALTFIHAYFNPAYVLVSGTAGGIKEGLKLGDVIVAECAFEAEIQNVFKIVKNTPFENCLKHPIKNEYFPACYPADSELLRICNSLNIHHLYQGTVVSSDVFPAPKELFEEIKSLNPYSIDMETSAFYQTAWLLNIKVLAIRAISNILNPDGTDGKIHESDVEGSAKAAAQVLFAILNASIDSRKENKSTVDHLDEEVSTFIQHYHLEPHTEGGFFALSYKSEDTVKVLNTDRYNHESRSASSSIFYLLNKYNYSSWHTLKSDEIWHYYKGSPVKIHVMDEVGVLSTYILGDPTKIESASFQVCVKAGCYFAAENVEKDAYSLVGCTVSPGFEYSDFKLADQCDLVRNFPQHRRLIERLSLN